MLETLYHYLISIIRILMNPYISINTCKMAIKAINIKLSYAYKMAKQCKNSPKGAITKYMHMTVISISFNNYSQLPIISKPCITNVNPFARCVDGVLDEYKHQKHTAKNKSYSRVLLEPCKTIYRIYWSMHTGFMEQ